MVFSEKCLENYVISQSNILEKFSIKNQRTEKCVYSQDQMYLIRAIVVEKPKMSTGNMLD